MIFTYTAITLKCMYVIMYVYVCVMTGFCEMFAGSCGEHVAIQDKDCNERVACGVRKNVCWSKGQLCMSL